MKKNFLVVLISILIILTVIMVIVVVRNYTSLGKIQITNTEEIEEPIEWHGNYIWNDSNDNNSWMCCRKNIVLKEKELKGLKAQISADSKYYLYINGELVVRDGAVKRGEKEHSIYYDNIDLTQYFHKGENTIAILAWYWGGESYSHISSGQAGVMFQMKVGKKYIGTDETWKVKRNEAYLQDELRPNNRLMEYNVWYDASLADEDWYKEDYDDSTWEPAKVLNIAESLPWGEMIERNIPMFIHDEKISEYENMADYKDYTTTSDEILEMKVPYNTHLTPYLKIEAPKGLKITIKTDTYEDKSGDSVKCTYITKEGVQEFESLPWMNGEKVYYEVPAGVKIISLGYRKSGYDTKMTGKFSSDDEFMNSLWEKADRTLYVNMRDSYMDCPNRERAQWLGDMNIEMMEAMYALDTNAYALYEKGIKTVIGWEQQDALITVVPNSLEPMHLPMQALAAIVGFYDYYEYTGKKEFLEEIYPYAKNYLNLWVEKENGLMDCTSLYYVWKWGDSATNIDYDTLENAFYYYAMSKVCQMAEVLENDEDKSAYELKLEKLKTSYNDLLWTTKGYKTKESKVIDERANAIAVLAGLADEEKYTVITDILKTRHDATPYMEKYSLEALCKMGNIIDAQTRMKETYNDMVNSEDACSTLWETWDAKEGTKNHAWSGGPLIIMSKYYAGIEPLEAGYEKISIKPQFGTLTKISADVTTIKGDINLAANKSENELKLKINVPTKTRIAVEKMSPNVVIEFNNKVIYENGELQENKFAQLDKEDENYIYFYVEKGKYEIISK